MFIIFIESEFIVTENCPHVRLQIVSGPYPKWTYRFDSPVGLYKVVLRVPFFVISPAAINTLIGLKVVPQVITV